MQVRIVVGQPWEARADVLVVPVFGGRRDASGATTGEDGEDASAGPLIDGVLGELDRRLGGELRALAAFGELTGKRNALTMTAGGGVAGGPGASDGSDSAITGAGEGAGRILLAGAGDPQKLTAEAVLHLAAAARRKLGGRTVRTVAIWLEPLAARLPGGLAAAAELATRGTVLGGFDPATIYREHVKSAPPVLDELVLVVPAGADPAALARAADRGRIIGEGSNWARRLSDRTANDVTPEVLADEAATIAARHGLWIDVISPERATQLGMGMFMAIGKGSVNPPRMIVVRSGAEGQRDALGRHLALVGKGVCFDTGGLSLKPSSGMLTMKHDKTGACTVLAAIDTVSRLAPGTPLLVVAPAVENMPGPYSTRPSDVVTALNGKRVEITNTDAEGRLILGDALVYAERLGATHLVDVATLTGAAHRALGSFDTPTFGTDDDFNAALAAAGRAAGERFWPLPLVEELRADLNSPYADLLNSPSQPEGGAIHAALFLREFVTRPWAHLDIAGTAYLRSAAAWGPKGATGVTHATLVELALAGAASR